MEIVALVVGATGIAGRGISQELSIAEPVCMGFRESPKDWRTA